LPAPSPQTSERAPADNMLAAPEHPVQPPHEAIEALHAAILKSLDDDQALDLVTIPLAGKSAIADHMVICSGRSTRQVASMAGKLAERIKAISRKPARIEGLQTADWVLIDADDVIVHIFRPEVRSFYNLERMWSFGEAPASPPLSSDLALDASSTPFEA